MSTLYVINLLSNSSGCHIVHRYGCTQFPDNFYEIGLYDSCSHAVRVAKDILPNATCCQICITGCKDPEHQKLNKHHINRAINVETE